jgi:hypothetical protein
MMRVTLMTMQHLYQRSKPLGWCQRSQRKSERLLSFHARSRVLSSESTIIGNQEETEAMSGEQKQKKKRKQKSGAQRKKEKRDRARDEATDTTMLTRVTSAVPSFGPKVNTPANVDAREQTLDKIAQAMSNLAKHFEAIEETPNVVDEYDLGSFFKNLVRRKLASTQRMPAPISMPMLSLKVSSDILKSYVGAATTGELSMISPAVFSEPAVTPRIIKLEPDDHTDDSFSTDLSDSDPSDTEAELEGAISDKGSSEPCVALIKYHGPIQSITDLSMLSLSDMRGFSRQQLCSGILGSPKHCLALSKYHGPIQSITDLILLSSPHGRQSVKTESSDEIQNVTAESAIELEKAIQSYFTSNATSSSISFQLRVPLKLFQRQVSIPLDTITTPPVLPPAGTSSKATIPASKTTKLPAIPTIQPTTSRGIAHPQDMNAQIGITTFREFLPALPDAYANTYSRNELVDAFIKFSSIERAELDLGNAHAHEADAVLRNKRLQHRVFLGSIKLVNFLRVLPFDVHDSVSYGEVAKAFGECAQKDKGNDEMDERRLGV